MDHNQSFMAMDFNKNRFFNHLVLIMMLESLHFALWLDYGTALSRALLLVHFGLFLIWQPIWRSDENFSYLNGSLFILLTLSFVYWINPILINAWLILLIGFLGGIIKQKREENLSFLTALTFLIMECLFRSTPELFSIKLSGPTEDIFRTVLILLPLCIFFFPAYQRRQFHVDLFRAISSSLLISLLMFGSLLNTLLSDTDYQHALVQSIMILAIGLIGISWLLSPRFGFSGLSQLWSQSLLNIGTPFERWMATISRIQQQTHDPDEFLTLCMRELTGLEWISGVEWNYSGNEFFEGNKSRHELAIDLPSFKTLIYTTQSTGSALQIHCNMLIKLIETMYVAKLNEQHIAEQAYMRSVYETGARITHDIKNLLQSLKLMTGMVEKNHSPSKEIESIQMIKQKLPSISKRLELALEKLQQPAELNSEMALLSTWLESTSERTEYEIKVNESWVDKEIPIDLFDSVFDNLIDNFQRKKQYESDIVFSISLTSDFNTLSMTFTDTGEAIPHEIAKKLFRTVIESEAGLGIGLFQLARMADMNGFELKLANNVNGRVVFELCSQSEDIN